MIRAGLAHVLLFFVVGVHAQERFGLAHSNFAGTDAVGLNPARMAGQWPYADIRVLGMDLFVHNDLVGLAGDDQGLVGHVREGISSGTIGNATMRTSHSNGQKEGFVATNALGPAFTLALGQGTVGASIGMRSFTSITGISSGTSFHLVNGLAYRPLIGERQQEENLHLTSVAATEVNLSYAHIVQAQGFGVLSAGATVRYRIAHAGAALSINDLDMTVVDTAQVDIHSIDGAYAIAMPAVNAGRGWGADLGFTYERSLEEVNGSVPHRPSAGCTPRPYRYRLGLSVLDLGGIHFRDALAGSVSAGGTVIADHEAVSLEGAEGLDSLFATFSNWSGATGARIGAASAVSLQYDQRVTDHVYVASAWLQRLPLRSGFRLRRSNSFSITPRFETRYFELALPVVMHEYDPRRPSVGLALRMGGLVIGSDHLLPIAMRWDTYTADLYFRLRIMLHRSPACKSKGRKRSTYVPGSKGALPCALPQ